MVNWADKIMNAAVGLSTTIRKLEEKLLEQNFRRSPALVSGLLSDDFYEIGASGRTFDKDAIIKDLSTEQPSQTKFTIVDFKLSQFSQDLVQARYRVLETKTLRSSIWRNDKDGWKIVFHQGTKEYAGD